MPHRIAGTSFTWEPSQETRGQVRKRLNAHLDGELDRIARVDLLQRRVARRRASPYRARSGDLPRNAGGAGDPLGAGQAGWDISSADTRHHAHHAGVDRVEDVPGRGKGQRRTTRMDGDP